MARSYPRLGSVSPPQKKTCSCCAQPAVNRIDIQEDHMRGNDEVMQVCEAHLAMARAGDWRELYGDLSVERALRRRQSKGAYA